MLPDGPMLHVRSYGPRFAAALPVVCLPGLARTAADFHPLAAALAADPAKPRHVLALDYRGHGKSKYDRYPSNYTPFVALADLLAVLTELKIGSATFIGTSYGGLLAMMLAVSRPAAIAGVVLNDIGPVIEPEGLLRLKLRIEGLGGKIPIPRNFEEGAEILRWLLHKEFAPSAFVQAARQHRERNAGTLISAPVNRNSYSRLSAGPPEW